MDSETFFSEDQMDQSKEIRSVENLNITSKPNTTNISENSLVEKPIGKSTSSEEEKIISAGKTKTTFYSFICHGRVAFGKYPSQSDVDKLINKKFSVFIDLTDFPKVFYSAPNIVRFPVRDGTVPTESMRKLIEKILKFIDKGHRVYIHCEHGRGRSVLLACCIIANLYELDYNQVIEIINDAHRAGHGANQKWRARLVPHHQCQRDYLRGFIDAL